MRSMVEGVRAYAVLALPCPTTLMAGPDPAIHVFIA